LQIMQHQDTAAPTLWTVGHSTRPLEDFIGLLHAQAIALLVDVRITPYSRRHPQFNTDALKQTLEAAGIAYRHFPVLGGRRKSLPDSINLGWKNASFRGYADYMQTAEFWRGLDELMACGRSGPTAVMCAEAVPWRCHRSLIADALVANGWEVRHILGQGQAKPHELTRFAQAHKGRLTYPTPADPDSADHSRLPF
jgi:uncharacterized protein (DUF488 family)